ncbi:hypothetical protein WN55_00968 [Dufourea novaeangliae]|nr:hypothetical protein WN55_00968 [Dufourea novaeangliae]
MIGIIFNLMLMGIEIGPPRRERPIPFYPDHDHIMTDRLTVHYDRHAGDCGTALIKKCKRHFNGRLACNTAGI